MLSFSISLELFKVQRPHSHEVALVPEGANLLHPFSKGTHDLLRVPGRVLGIGLQAVKVVIVELNFHPPSLGRIAEYHKSHITHGVKTDLVDLDPMELRTMALGWDGPSFRT